MAGIDVFISYKTERRKAAEHLAEVLKGHSYSAWFDYEMLKGSNLGLEIGRRIHEAKALVVLWCSMSVDSRWVTEEAHLAHELGTLIPVVIEPCRLPLGFQRHNYIDLSSWDGFPRSPALDPLVRELSKRIGRPPQLDLPALWTYEDTWRRFGAPSLRAFALGKPVAAVEDDRPLPPAATISTPEPARPVAPAPANSGHELMALAAREWPAVRDSADPRRLERFERYFAGTFYAEEARALREEIEGRRRRAEGRIPVVGDRSRSETRWLVPGGGEWFCDIDGGPEMVVVPAGKFVMGSPAHEPGRSDDEGPQHEVTFARPFAVGRHAVTHGQFAAFVKATGHKTSGPWRDPGFKQDDRHPVVCVSWDDSKAYAAWLAEITGRPYRLLSEAEWEYAARAGTTTPFWWGPSITPAQANYDGNFVYAGGGSKGEFRMGTVPVGSFDPNPWGLYNVPGNVWEWCEDTWHDTYDGAPTDGSAWIFGSTESGRVVRGGAWISHPWVLRAAYRLGVTAVLNYNGFRLARTLTP